ncbi:hypothetical protein [Marisediminicola sp. LYQ134]|uniref:hypothetical protein n=1 Tax=Marisediminicola sp. LYQ134 TaxID=3391061 RepID=UPI003983A635
MTLRTVTRTTLAILLAVYVLAAMTAVEAQTTGWPLLGLTAAAVLLFVATALIRKDAR